MKIMKKNLLYLFMLICSVSLFTGCSDDDDNGGGDLAMALQSSVLGTYEGDLLLHRAPRMTKEYI